MKTIGLIGGTGWVSTIEYYRLINQETNKRLGRSSSARCLIHSFNFEEIISRQEKGDNEGIYSMILEAAIKLEKSGADGIALCANTMHKYASKLNTDIHKPIIHIAEATAKVINHMGLTTVGLLGTQLTMELDFYTAVLKNFGITAIVPSKPERDVVHSIIFNELIKSQFNESSRKKYLRIIDGLVKDGAQGIVLGCTEIPLLIQQNHTDIPLFNTLDIHATSIVDFILS